MHRRFAATTSLLLSGLAALVFCPTAAGQGDCGAAIGHGNADSLLVTTAWLQEHLHDPGLVILQVDNDEFSRAHIPGARPIAYMSTHEMQSGGLTLEMPKREEFGKLLAPLGVTNDSRIVLVQSGDGLASTARIRTTLDLYGLGARTAILNGGWNAWKAAQRPISDEAPTPATGALTLCHQPDVLVTLDYVKTHLRTPGIAIIDARAAEFYSGQTQPSGQRRGHIPGAVNIPFTTITGAHGQVKSRAELAQLFQEAGIKANDRIVAYCHIGQQANAVIFAARLLGYDARLFDGSWEEWSKHTDLPAERSANSGH